MLHRLVVCTQSSCSSSRWGEIACRKTTHAQRYQQRVDGAFNEQHPHQRIAASSTDCIASYMRHVAVMLLLSSQLHVCAAIAVNSGIVLSAALLLAGLVLNSILVAQILVYGNKGVAAQKVRGKAAVKKAA
jgi:hypothetical protein